MSREFVRYCCAFALGVLLVGVMPSRVVAAGLSLDREGGFRDAKLGAPFASFRGLKKVRTHGGVDYYARRGDSLTYAGLKLGAILYGFSGGVLQRVQLHTVKAQEPPACVTSDRIQVLDGAITAYSDVSVMDEFDPMRPSKRPIINPFLNQCAADAGPIEDCEVYVYNAKKIEVQLRVVVEEYKRETSRRVLTSEQLSALLRKEAAKALSGVSAHLTRQIMREELGVPEGAAFYEGRDGGVIAVATLPSDRFDVVTRRDVPLCYQVVQFSFVPPPYGWTDKYFEKMEQEKK